MLDFNSYILAKIDEIISQFSGPTLIFFKGFSAATMEHLIAHPSSLLNDRTLLKNGLIDFVELNDKWIDFLSAIKGARQPLIGFYEELLAIAPFLSRISIDRIVVVENNILAPWVPCCLPHEEAVKLFDYWQEEHEPREKSMEILTQFYGDVKLINTDQALLLPINIGLSQ